MSRLSVAAADDGFSYRSLLLADTHVAPHLRDTIRSQTLKIVFRRIRNCDSNLSTYLLWRCNGYITIYELRYIVLYIYNATTSLIYNIKACGRVTAEAFVLASSVKHAICSLWWSKECSKENFSLEATVRPPSAGDIFYDARDENNEEDCILRDIYIYICI